MEASHVQPMTQWEKDLRYYADRVTILKGVLTRKDMQNDIKKYAIFHEYVNHVAKAGTQWDSTATNADEMIPTILSNQIQEDALALGNLFSKIRRETVPARFDMSRVDDQMQFFKGAVLTAPSASTPATAKASFRAEKIIGYAKIAYETDQDTIVASVNILMSQLPAQLDGAIEQVLISGDDAGTHQDADIEAVANHSAKTFDGLRRIALDNTWTKDIAGNFVSNSIRDMRSPLTTRSVRAFRDSFWIFGGNVYEQARQIASTRTMDVIGSQATNLGPLTTLDGSEVLLSEHMREDTNSAGVNAATTAGANKASCIFFDRRHFMIGQIAPVLIETDRTITSQTIDLVLSIRLDFQQILKTAKRPMTLAFNITKV